MNRTSEPALVGRTVELELLEAALAEARGGRPRTVLLGGEAGIGKSRLVEMFLAGIPDATATVALGACPPVGEVELPFAGIVDALRSLLRSLAPGEREAVLASGRAQVARLLPGLGPPDEGDDAGARTRLFEALLGLVEQAGEVRGVAVLVVEDLHWADPSTREALAYLVRNLRDASVLIVGTFRSDGVPAGHPVRVLLAELDRSSRVERRELERLTPDEVGRQLEAILGAAVDPPTLAQVVARSDGNPFFVEELGAAVREGKLERVPETLRETMLARFAPQPPEVQELLRLGAVIGWRLDPRLLAAAAPFEEPLLLAVLREAVRQQLLVQLRDAAGEAFTFRQHLLREVVYEELLPMERERRHAVVAAALEADPSLLPAATVLRDAELARHWLAADVPERAYGALIRAGFAAEASYAFPEAAHFLEAALAIRDRALAAGAEGSVARADRRIGFRPDRLGGGPGPADGEPGAAGGPDLADLVRRTAEVASLAGAVDRSVALLRQVVESAGPAVPAEVAARDRLTLGRYLAQDGDPEAALEAYDRAAERLEARPDAPDGARIQAARARALVALGRYAEARTAAEIAVGLAQRHGRTADIRLAREALGVALASGGDFEAGLAHLAEARRLAIEPRRTSVVMPRPSRIGELVGAFADLQAILDRAGRGEEADAASREGAEIARRLGVETTWGRTLEITAARGLVLRGDWDEADRLTRELLAGRPRGAPAARIHLARARLETGRGAFDEAAAHLEGARANLPARPEPQLLGDLASVEAELAVWRSQLTLARETVGLAIRRLDSVEDRLPVLGLAWLGIRAEADRAEQARARRATAEVAESLAIGTTLLAEARALQGQLSGRESIAPRELRTVPALVEAEWGRLEGRSDADSWEEAARRAMALPDRALAAYCGWRRAEAVLSARGPRSAAEPSLQQAWATATELGARALLAEIEALARRARLRLEPDAPSPDPSPSTARDTLGLSAREMEVLALVAAGYTNRRIGEALFITEKTAGHHVSNVLGKLAASTRVEAAAIAHRLGLLDDVEVPVPPG